MTNCTIIQTNNYIETFLVCPVAALPGQYQIVIQSQLLSAKDPTVLQVKYRAIVSSAALRELGHALRKVIIPTPKIKQQRIPVERDDHIKI